MNNSKPSRISWKMTLVIGNRWITCQVAYRIAYSYAEHELQVVCVMRTPRVDLVGRINY